MEKRLEDFINAARVVSGIDDLANTTPIVLHKTNPAISKTVIFVVSKVEPDQMVLPLNVVWINCNANSSDYLVALQRQSKDPDPNGVYTHTYESLYYYDDAFVAQFYDEEDGDAIKDTAKVSVASVDTLGIVKLNENPPDGEDPVVIIDTDSRLSDARTPLDHEHAEKPATMLASSSTTVTIGDADQPEVGNVLVAIDSMSAEWRKLTKDDIGA